MMAHDGQSFCTGSRRTGRTGLPGAGFPSVRATPAMREVSWIVMSGGLQRRRGGGEKLQAALFDRDEFRRQRNAARTRARIVDRDGLEDAAGPRAHHVDL